MRDARFVIKAGFWALSASLAASGAWAAPPKAAGPAFVPAGPGMASTIGTDIPDTVPHTLMDTLGLAYQYNPQLTGERAHLRATDENVPSALSGWRPTISVTGSYGPAVGRFEQTTLCGNQTGQFGLPAAGAFQAACYTNGIAAPNSATNYRAGRQYVVSQLNNRNVSSVQAVVTQYLYRGGATTAKTHQAVNSVYAERARLIATEEQVFLDTINAYIGVVEDTQLLELDRANEQVLGDELRAINDRFRVGELTRTDVAQAEAALAQAIATRQTAEGTLQTANATFVREVGVQPPKDLINPQPLKQPVSSREEAEDLAVQNNPTYIAALFNQAELRDEVDVAFAALGPNVYIQGQGFDSSAQTVSGQASYGAQATINLSLPIYQGGQEYAAVRSARQNYLQAVRETEDARRLARQQAAQAWDTLIAARASIDSSHVAVKSSEIALEGLEREALVGTATTQNVLIGQQNLLAAQITLVQNVTSLVTASYNVASAIGRLTARDMALPVPLYDETAYYNAVRDRLWGTGDHAIHEPGR